MANLLSPINSPADLKKIPVEQLPSLAQEIRQKIIEVVAKNGGHLGSNLGVIELTIALHYVFNFAQDRLLWDVSHQCYTHKILTGRKDNFDTLRQLDGLSGFTNPKESVYDIFTAGHAGTALSTGLGLACADTLHNRNRKIVSIVGDGAMTCGMTYEALNHAGALQKPILVILNDNKMSISKTIGAMANYLTKLRTTHIYKDIMKEAVHLLDRLPIIGPHAEKALSHLRASAFALTGGFIFEEMGFVYYGPIDGHNIPLMINTLKEIQRSPRPVILHIITEKGRGSTPALEDPYRFHGIGPKKIFINGKVRSELGVTPQPTYTAVFAKTIVRLAQEEPHLVAITAAMPDGTGLVEFERKFPDRYFDVGICEQHAIGLATGLSTAGLKPVVAIYSTFLQRAFDQLFHEIALQKSPVIFVLDRAGLVGSDGRTHNGLLDIAYTRIFPDFILLAPKDGVELERMIEFSLGLNAPVFIRYPRANIPEPKDLINEPLRLGKAEVLKKGKDGALLAYGTMVYTAYEAAIELANEGINLTVVNARFAKPLDEELIRHLIKEQPFLITLEEHSLSGGFGSAVLELYTNKGWRNCKIICLGIPDKFIPHGPRDTLLAQCGLNIAHIVKTVKETKHTP